jgi:hypothetical protein|tara:strand:+ start:53 stop:340 length:288 start_codon:yes stop_codon:yes gene_type:complete
MEFKLEVEVKALSKVLENHDWIFAKTMPNNPHFYTRKKDWNKPELFIKCAHKIRQHGNPEMFRGWPYVCFNYNGYKYWVMDKNPDDAVIINRKEI